MRKRYVRKKRGFRRRYKKGGRKFSSKIKQIVRSTEETKKFISTGFNAMLTGGFYYNNIMWDLASGTNDFQVIGSSVFLDGFRLHLDVKNGTDPFTDQPTQIRVMVIRMEIFQAGSLINQWVPYPTTSDIVRTSADTMGSPYNWEIVQKVLYDKLFHFSNAITGTVMHFHKSIYIKIKRKFKWNSVNVNSGAGKDYNYYILMTTQREGSSGLGTAVTATLTKSVYYKDA